MKVYTDGGCTQQANPDRQKRIMTVAVTDESGTVLVEKSRYGGSNNIAELWAICEAMIFAKSCNIQEVDVYTDSLNSIRWMKKGKPNPKVNDPQAVENLLRAIKNLQRHVKLSVTWIPREKNQAGIYMEFGRSKS